MTRSRGALVAAILTLLTALPAAPVAAQTPATTPPDTFMDEVPWLYDNAEVSTFHYISDQDGVTFECSLDGGPWEPCLSEYRLPEGEHTMLARAVDGAGTADPTPDEWTWVIDRTAPTVAVTGPARSSSPDVTFRFTSDDPDADFYCYLGPGEEGWCAPELLVTDHPDGSYELTVWAVDLADNWSAPATHRYTVDLPPTLALRAGHHTAPGFTTGDTGALHVEAGGATRIECRRNLGSWYRCADGHDGAHVLVFANLAEGSHRLEARAVDAAGQASTTVGHTLTVDRTAPTVRFSSSPPVWGTDATARFRISASEPVTLACTLDEGRPEPCAADWSRTLPYGAHRLQVLATDRAGNGAWLQHQWNTVEVRRARWARDTADACPPGRVPSAGFRDVTAGTSSAALIDCLAWWGITKGTGGGRYSPSGTVTRGMMAAFVVRTLEAGSGIELPRTRASFSDVSGHPFAAEIGALEAAGIVSGYGGRGGEFRPDELVRRDHMAKFLAYAYAFRTGQPLPSSGADHFPDDSSSSVRADIDRIAGVGITQGFSDGTYRPAEAVRRDHMAAFLLRLLDLLVDLDLARAPS